MSGGHDKHFAIEPSRFQWHKFKDLVHYYILVGAIPCFAVVFYTNVFIGPATLTETPKDYVPKHWEYFKHPITRFMSRYMYASPQEDYEKMLHALKEDMEKMEIRKLEDKIKQHMHETQDYEAYYYRPVTAKYTRQGKKAKEEQEFDRLGE